MPREKEMGETSRMERPGADLFGRAGGMNWFETVTGLLLVRDIWEMSLSLFLGSWQDAIAYKELVGGKTSV